MGYPDSFLVSDITSCRQDWIPRIWLYVVYTLNLEDTSKILLAWHTLELHRNPMLMLFNVRCWVKTDDDAAWQFALFYSEVIFQP